MRQSIDVVGYAVDTAGALKGSAKGPVVMKESPYWASRQINLHWQAVITPPDSSVAKEVIASACEQLGKHVMTSLQNKNFFMVLGGDHSSAIGTWSAASLALQSRGALGLIWIDAHMDSHTPATSLSGNIHGMPLAVLLGEGDVALTHLFSAKPKLMPAHVCLIGVRSYEAGEAELLKKLNVRIFFMEEVERRGLDAVMADALQIVTQGTAGFGISIDIDSIDPIDAPGTGVAEANGLSGEKLCAALKKASQQSGFIGAEITEFDPTRDQEHVTEMLVTKLVAAMVN